MSNTIRDAVVKVYDRTGGGKVEPNGKESGINIEDTFNKTDGEGPSIGKLTTAAGVGAVLGMGAAISGKVSDCNKRLDKLEKKVDRMDSKNSQGEEVEEGDNGPSRLQSLKEKIADNIADVAEGIIEKAEDVALFVSRDPDKYHKNPEKYYKNPKYYSRDIDLLGRDWGSYTLNPEYRTDPDFIPTYPSKYTYWPNDDK